MHLDELRLFDKKIFLVGPPETPRRGYFKDFRLFFIILGFKRIKMDQKREVLSQISCIRMRYNIIVQKKIHRTPLTLLGVVIGGIFMKFWCFLLFFAKITLILPVMSFDPQKLWLKITLRVSTWCLNRSKNNYFEWGAFGGQFSPKKCSFVLWKCDFRHSWVT